VESYNAALELFLVTPLIRPAMLYGQKTTTPTLIYNKIYKHWKLMNDLIGAKFWLNLFLGYDQCKERWW
jgi:hypothetical protein